MGELPNDAELVYCHPKCINSAVVAGGGDIVHENIHQALYNYSSYLFREYCLKWL